MKMIDVECPFTVGQCYRAKERLAYLNHIIPAGNRVVFVNRAYDQKLGVARFNFKNVETGEINAWHVWDDNHSDMANWLMYFERC